MMVSFSQRMGFEPVKKTIQIDSINDDLRNGLWNVLCIYIWDYMQEHGDLNKNNIFIQKIWMFYFKNALDRLSTHWDEIRSIFRKHFFSCAWNKLYDFIEFIASNYEYKDLNLQFVKFCNIILEKENSAYRFVDGKIIQITSKEEINEIEEALTKTDPIKPIQIHLKTALQLLSDRKSPDYRNSIKESISAVESICKIISKDPKVDLYKALKTVRQNITIHPALEQAFIKLYAYSSDEDGIRHALMNESTLEYEDAKFMLVSCSAFINYLIAKSAKAGIKIK